MKGSDFVLPVNPVYRCVEGSAHGVLSWQRQDVAASAVVATMAAALGGHGVFDFFHHRFIENPGVPVWWPGFCLAFDLLAGGFLAVLLIRRSSFARTV